MLEALYTTNHLVPEKFLILFGILFGVIFVRYLVLSYAFHYVFRISLQKVLGNRDLIKAKLDKDQAKKEIWYSLISAVIFAFISIAMIIGWQNGFVQLYLDASFPWWYVPLSIASILVLHDTYYYWLHRLIHYKPWYRWMHKVHHDSVKTSAYTSFSFHPAESIAQAIIIPVLLLFIPMHVYAFFGLLIFMTVSAIINHLGVEVYPAGKLGRWFARWFIGATHHDQHHRKFKVNYGLYFTFWDKLMGTESEEFEALYEKVVEEGNGKIETGKANVQV